MTAKLYEVGNRVRIKENAPCFTKHMEDNLPADRVIIIEEIIGDNYGYRIERTQGLCYYFTDEDIAGLAEEVSTVDNQIWSKEAEMFGKDRPGNKYHRTIHDVHFPMQSCLVDVYEVIEAFSVTCPARQHAIKKLLCSGIRGKGDVIQDLTEAKDAIQRAIEMERNRR